MAFKNSETLKQMMKKKTDPEPEAVAKEEKAVTATKKEVAKPVVKKTGDQIMTDKNGVKFLQMTAFKVNKASVLNIRITEETKINIDNLAKKYKLSQSDLITALVADAVKRDAEAAGKE